MMEEYDCLSVRFRVRWCKILVPLCMCILALLPTLSEAAMSVVVSKHNLSSTGPGTIKALSEGEVCIFCHTPHKARSIGVLWNREDSTAIYIPYDSTTINTLVGQPTGASRLCLSCHDGTIALGMLFSRTVEVNMTQRFLETGPGALTTDLSDDHPVSFVYDSSLWASNPELRDPSLLMDEVLLDSNDEMQCTSCHDPHDDSNGKFLRVQNVFSALCLNCHQPNGWSISTHRISSAQWSGLGPDPWPHTEWITVDNNACESCHRPHHAGGKERLMNALDEEDNCYPCHNGNVAALNVESEFTKAYIHPVSATTGIHDPTEDFITMPRHVECADCHNPHQVNSTSAIVPAVTGRLAGVSGVDISGTPLESAVNEYEVCFKCHGDSASGIVPISRQILDNNTRLEFDLSNPSFHPVVGPRQNPEVISLLPQYNTSSMIYCTDCHNSDNGPGAGGGGPSGPHGSQYPFLLERQYVTIDNTSETSDTYALCYKCHDRNSILGDESFTAHNLHIVGQQSPCSICHDPHGISDTQGNAINNSSLINFDVSVVLPETVSGQILFEDLGTYAGRCTLNCHGSNHNPKSY